MAGDGVVHGRPAAAIRHVHDLDAGALATAARRSGGRGCRCRSSAYVMVSGFAFAAATTSANVLNGREGCVRSDVRRGADQQHRVEVLLGIERQALQKRIDRVGVEHEQPGAAVRRRLRRPQRCPRLPDAPGLFSMMMVAPSRCCRPGCTMRAIGSTVPPGGNGTMILMTLAVRMGEIADGERRRHRTGHQRTPCECVQGCPPWNVVPALIAVRVRSASDLRSNCTSPPQPARLEVADARP